MTPSTNPHFSGLDGSYGWSVPIGTYRVRFEHPQYQSFLSEPTQVSAFGLVHVPLDIDAVPVAGIRAGCIAIPTPPKTGNAGLLYRPDARHNDQQAGSSSTARAVTAVGLLSLLTVTAPVSMGVRRRRMR
jgi:hypothetical protein